MSEFAEIGGSTGWVEGDITVWNESQTDLALLGDLPVYADGGYAIWSGVTLPPGAPGGLSDPGRHGYTPKRDTPAALTKYPPPAPHVLYLPELDQDIREIHSYVDALETEQVAAGEALEALRQREQLATLAAELAHLELQQEARRAMLDQLAQNLREAKDALEAAMRLRERVAAAIVAIEYFY